jgi:hypothetical protein
MAYDANADPVTNTQPNAGATRATGRWTLEEDGELTRAFANTSKKNYSARQILKLRAKKTVVSQQME